MLSKDEEKGYCDITYWLINKIELIESETMQKKLCFFNDDKNYQTAKN